MNPGVKLNVTLVSVGVILSIVFAIDCLLQGTVVVSIAYIVAVFLSGLTYRPRFVQVTAFLSVGLTLVGWWVTTGLEIIDSSAADRILVVSAIGLTAFLSLRVRMAQPIMSKHRFLSDAETVSDIGSAELAKARDRLELGLASANVGLWDWNAQTNDVYFSPTYKTQIGFPVDVDWNNFTDWESRLHPDDHGAAIGRVHAYFAHETDEYKSLFRLLCADGAYRWILAQGKAKFGANGEPYRMIGVHVDITEQVNAERELKRLNRALAVANEAYQESNVELQQFAYVASHDLQTPLRAISGFTQLLEADYAGKIDEQADDYIQRIVGGVKRMQKMIADLLDYSRVESHAAPFDVVPLNEVFDDSIVLLEEAIRENGACVTRDDLPSLVGDRSQLSQLLTNLIGNAIKYHRDDPKVHISAAHDENGWTIFVRDNGIGIAKTHHERIFEVFRRLHSRQEYPGTGIGLAICRRIVKRHHGKIWVDSEEGVGTTFFVYFPDGHSPIPSDRP